MYAGRSGGRGCTADETNWEIVPERGVRSFRSRGRCSGPVYGDNDDAFLVDVHSDPGERIVHDRTLLCPITSQVKAYPFEVVIPARLKVSGATLSDQVKSLDWRARKAESICRLPEFTVSEILQ